MERFVLTYALIVLNLSYAMSQTGIDDSTIIHFANPETEATVRARLVNTYGQNELADESVPITVGEAAKIEKLHLSVQDQVNPFDGVDLLPNLKHLTLAVAGGPETLTDLGKLPHLISLRIFLFSETELVIPEGLGKLEYLAIFAIENEPPPISLRVESSLPSLERLDIDFALQSVYLDAAVMPALMNLYISEPALMNLNISDLGTLGGWHSSALNGNLTILEISNTFPTNVSVWIQDSGLMKNYDSLLMASQDATSFSLYKWDRGSVNAEATYDLDFRAFSNLKSLSISSGRVGKLQLPDSTDKLTNLTLGYVLNTSIRFSNPKAKLQRITIHNSQINEVYIHPDIELENFSSSLSHIEKLVMTIPQDFWNDDTKVTDLRVSPRLRIKDDSVSYESIGGQYWLLESQDMLNWKPIHTSPDYSGQLQRYTYRKGIRSEARQKFYRLTEVRQ